MKTKHIIVKLSESDTFTSNLTSQEDVLNVSLDQLDERKMVKTRLFNDLADLQLVPSNTMFDLVNLALSIYTIDQVVSRQVNGFQGWSRNLIVYFPVNDKALWDNIKSDFANYISFLSGDKWEFLFRQNEEIRFIERLEEPNPENYTKVSLLSGGLDSFIGAIDLLRDEERPFFISHYKSSESKVQGVIIEALKNKFGRDSFKAQKIWVQPNQKNEMAEKENSSRARSFLFITLGLTAANCLGDNIELILPENGLISLNIPLTRTRISSHSTRTTHPYFVEGLNSILMRLGITNKIINPYRFKTKGEMMLECKDVDFLNQHYSETISCSHPENSRYSGKSPGLNCGYCVPCIIRQSAERKAGEINTEYAIDDVKTNPPFQKTKKGADYRAFKLALKKLDSFNENHSLALQIIRSGPIPYEDILELNEYISVYKRGMAEVKQFLNS